jgi:hypothetical protein
MRRKRPSSTLGSIVVPTLTSGVNRDAGLVGDIRRKFGNCGIAQVPDRAELASAPKEENQVCVFRIADDLRSSPACGASVTASALIDGVEPL